ncbi:MAG: 30S ribosome-binding factor RbfA [Clostridium sp.]|jgi:ribosome-binding factor A|nr:30S ribosome-binding factor RbfA [Clostridium sp.]
MSKHRLNRINEEMKKELANILREIKDPRVQAMVSVTDVDVTNDLKYAKIYLSIFGTNKTEEAETLEALNKAKGFIRHQLSRTLNLRNTPELRLIEDTTIDYGMHIDSLLREVLPEESAKKTDDADVNQEDEDGATEDSNTEDSNIEQAEESQSVEEDAPISEKEEDEKA